MLLLLRLITAHLITDFLLQSQSWIEDRKANKYKSIYLYLHGLITGIAAYLFLGKWNNFQVPLFIMITHIIIDIWKSYQQENTKYFIIDQFLHFVILLISWLYVTDQAPWFVEQVQVYLADIKVWALISGYIAIIWPMNYLIAFATEKWRKDINNDGLKDAGRIIGQIERILIVTFVLFDHFEAIGFLIAAKSIFRYSDVQKDRKEAEYILTGTLLSFAASIILGIIIKLVIFI